MSLYSVEYFVDELETVCSALEINKVHILGQGWGNMLAGDYMLQKNLIMW
jgi:pimeloyl-ACP methyl ester carboxylesterase